MLPSLRLSAALLAALVALSALARAQEEDDPFGSLFGEPLEEASEELPEAPLERARVLAHSGRYGEAETALRTILAEEPEREDALLLLAHVALDTGQPAVARQATDALLELQPDQPEPYLLEAALAERAGDVAAARAAYEQAIELGGRRRSEARLEALVRLGELLAEVDGAAAQAVLERALEYYQRFDELSPAEFTWVGRACLAVDRFPELAGEYSQSMTEYARRMLDQALAADPEFVPALVLAGEQALSKLNTPLAHKSFARAVELNPNHAQARVGLARAALEGFYGGAGRYDTAAQGLQKALEADPTCAEAHATLAGIAVTDGNYDAAEERIATGLRERPGDVSLLAVRGAVLLLRGQGEAFAALERELLAARPRCARFYVEIAALLQLKFRYAEARDLARKALELDPGYHPALPVLGVNLTRTGAEEEGREVLAEAFARDPYDVFVFNHLQLWDRLDDHYTLVDLPGFRLRLHKEEEAVTARYVGPLLAEAKERLGGKYGPIPDPVLVELFPDHDDFSARSVGLPGIPALGVCFGNVMTVLSSKEKRAAGAHSWGRTLWHEFAHVATLTRTQNRVPRWLTEGLSVYEEPRGRRTWLREYDADIMTLLAHDLLLPIARLDEGFTKPRYPQQVIMSYYQGGMICEYVDARWGFDKILALLDAFAAGQDTAAAVRSVLGLEPEAFDAQFRAFLERRYARYAWLPPPSLQQRQALLQRVTRHPWDVAARGALAWAYALHGSDQDAITQAQLALRHATLGAEVLGPLAGLEAGLHAPGGADLLAARAAGLRAGAGDAYLALGLVAQRRGRVGQAERHAERALELGTRDPVLAWRLRAMVRRARKDWAGTIRALEEVGRRSPPSADHHRLLHACRKAAGDPAGAMAELREVCRLDSNDAETRVIYATWARERGRWAEVAEVLDDINLIDPFLPDAHVMLGEALRRTALGDPAKLERAILELEVALQLEVPYRAGPRFGIAACLHALGRDPERVRALLKEALAEDPDHEEARALAERLGGG